MSADKVIAEWEAAVREDAHSDAADPMPPPPPNADQTGSDTPSSPIHIYTPFNRNNVQRFLHYSLSQLPGAYTSLDTNRLTLMHFLVNSLDVIQDDRLFNPLKGEEIRTRVKTWICNCCIRPSAEEAGFIGGTFMGLPFNSEPVPVAVSPKPAGSIHIAMTYCGLLTLLALNHDLATLPYMEILNGLSNLQNTTGPLAGSFKSHHEGSESDMRFLYCAVCIDRILWKLHSHSLPYTGSKYIRPSLILQFITNSVTYDGGISLSPGLESHGGSYFTGLAALSLMDRVGDVFDGAGVQDAIKWGVNRQIMGMQGRCNKPADTCYSFWVGGGLHILEQYLKKTAVASSSSPPPDDLLASKNVIDFILQCQHPVFGGFGKLEEAPPDVLHTFYSLCYLSMSKPDLKLAQVDVEFGVSRRVGDFIRSDDSYEDIMAKESAKRAAKQADAAKQVDTAKDNA